MIVRSRVKLEARVELEWRFWPGSLAGKITYEAFKLAGVTPTFPFRVTPPEGFKRRLKPRDTISYEFYSWGSDALEAAEALARGLELLKEFVLDNLVSAEIRDNFQVLSGKRKPFAYFFEIAHCPTFYRFHGAFVPYPSPKRMVLSLFRRIDEAFGTDTRTLSLSIAEKLELVGGNHVKKVYKLNGRLSVPAFSGRATYYGILEEKEIINLRNALRFVAYLGLGQGPGVGFGHVSSWKEGKPPFSTPVPAWPGI